MTFGTCGIILQCGTDIVMCHKDLTCDDKKVDIE